MSRHHRLWTGAVASVITTLLASPAAEAAIATSVAANSTTGIAGFTAWPLPFTLSTTGATAPPNNPGAFNINEGNFGAPAFFSPSLAQSFTATAGMLTGIQFAVTGTAPLDFNFKIYRATDTDSWQDNGSIAYSPMGDPGENVSANLLTDTTMQQWAGYTLMGATAAVISVQLTGADQITLVEGGHYIVEIETPTAPPNVQIFRNGDNAINYPLGQAYRARAPLNGNPARDFAMAFTITPPVTLSADFDSSNAVNDADLVVWSTSGNFGTTTGATKATGDADLDGDVDGNDFLIWQRQLGQTAATPAASAVPEPASSALAVFALAVVARWRRRLA